MQNGSDGLFQILNGYPLFLAVECMAAGEDVRTGQAHERQPRAIGPAADAAADWCHSCASDGFQPNLHDARVAVEHLFHVAVLFLYFKPVVAAGMLRYHLLDDRFQFLLVPMEVVVVEITDDKLDGCLLYAPLDGYRVDEAFASACCFGRQPVFWQGIHYGGRNFQGTLQLSFGKARMYADAINRHGYPISGERLIFDGTCCLAI